MTRVISIYVEPDMERDIQIGLEEMRKEIPGLRRGTYIKAVLAKGLALLRKAKAKPVKDAA